MFRLSSVDALLARVRVGRKREVEDVPEEWRVVTGRDRDGEKEIRPGGGIIGYCQWWC